VNTPRGDVHRIHSERTGVDGVTTWKWFCVCGEESIPYHSYKPAFDAGKRHLEKNSPPQLFPQTEH
jgi:hypothetical protein